MKRKFSLLYILADGFRNLRENLSLAVLSAITVGFSLFILAFFVMVFTNLHGVIWQWADRTHMVVYIKDDALKDVKSLSRALKGMEGIKEVRYVSKDDAMRLLRKELEGMEGVLEGIRKEVLPASFDIRVKKEFVSPEGIGIIAARIKKFPWVEDIQYGTEWVERFASFVRFMEVWALIIGAFLTGATLFIIANTIKLAIYSRKEEIEIMEYLGADDWYIKTPFVIEGTVQGVCGGLLAALLVFTSQYILSLYVPEHFAFIIENPFSTLTLTGGLVVAGFVLGGVGSLLSLSRFLRV